MRLRRVLDDERKEGRGRTSPLFFGRIARSLTIGQPCVERCHGDLNDGV